MKMPRTPMTERLAPTGEARSRVPMTPNSRAPHHGGLEGGVTQATTVPGPAAQTARAWRIGGDRKTMFESRGRTGISTVVVIYGHHSQFGATSSSLDLV